MKTIFKKIDRILIPPNENMRLAPYIWLVYLAFFFTSLIEYPNSAYGYWCGAVGTLAFLGIYFHGYWAKSRTVHWNIIAIVLIGTFLATITPGASVFFVYAATFCCRMSKPSKSILGIALIMLWLAVFSLLFEMSPYFYMPAALFSILIGGITIYQYQMDKKNKELILSQQEVKVLARTAERERIARDLHDLIGHTFTVITIKAELARKLMVKDQHRACREIKELEDISRDALKQVREVVTGYRTSDLSTELAHAKYILESNDVRFDYQLDDIKLDDNINKELAIIVKELVTNILKHAQASKVSASVSQENDQVFLQVSDDGVGFSDSAKQVNSLSSSPNEQVGYGLKGIQERVARLAGTLSIESSQGVTFKIQIPMEHKV